MNIRFWMGRGLAVLTSGVIIAVGLGGCTTSREQAGGPDAGAPPLRVGVTPNMPPLIYKQGRDIVGLEVDLARALGRELARPVQFVELTWDDQIPALRAKKTDIIMSGMSVTKMRAMRVAFTDSYLQVGQLALVRRSDLDRYITRGSVMMSDGRVGVEKATIGDLFVQQEFIRAKRVVYSSPAAAVKDLRSGRLDIVIHDAPVIWWLAAENEAQGLAAVNIPLTTEYLAWGMREDPALLKSVNGILTRWKQSDKLQGMVKRWIPYARQN